MENMMAVVRQGLGYGEVGMEERPVPDIGEYDVLLRVKAAGLCGSDVNTYRGLESPVKPGTILGHEFAGEVAKVGSRVTRWKAGDRVVSDNTGSACGTCYACSRGDFLMCEHRKSIGGLMDGGFAPYIRLSGDILNLFPNSLLHIPDSVSYEEAAILDPYANAYNAIIQQGGLTLGDSLLITGAGSMALACIDIARAAGAIHIITLVRSTTGQIFRDAVKRMGATAILESDEDDYVGYVKDMTGGEGLPIMVNTAGSNSLFAPAMELIRKGGKLVQIGFDPEPLQESMVRMIRRGIAVIGHLGYNSTAWKQVLALLEAGRIHPRACISEIVPLSEFHDAMEKAVHREIIKAVFIP